MSDQLSLFRPIVHVSNRGTIEERFERFHAANEHIYFAIVMLARGQKMAGARRIGMKQIFEELRFRAQLVTKGEPYKINNDFSAMYARMLFNGEPDIAPLLELRVRKRAA